MDIVNKFKNAPQEAKYLCLLIVYCCGLLVLRIVYLQEWKFIFLFWNIFLATIPFVVLHRIKYKSKLWKYIGLLVSILFLPNAPYVLTDLIHWNNQNTIKGWYDWQMLLTFGLTGLWSFYLSLRMIWIYLNSFNWPIGSLALRLIFYALFPMMGFGIYLGRIERYNSWDAVIHPFQFINDMVELVLFNYQDIFLFSLIYSFFLWFTYFILSFKHTNS